MSSSPYFGANDCGFAVFGLRGVPTTATVSVSYAGPDGSTFATADAAYDATDAEWSLPIHRPPRGRRG